MARSVFALSLVVAFLVVAPISAIQVEILRSVGGLPPHLVGTFESPVNFLQAASGAYYIFDRRGQAVFSHSQERPATGSKAGCRAPSGARGPAGKPRREEAARGGATAGAAPATAR